MQRSPATASARKSCARPSRFCASTEKKFGFTLEITEAPVGWAGIDAAGKALPDATLALCKKSDSILFGSVGLPDRDPDDSQRGTPRTRRAVAAAQGIWTVRQSAPGEIAKILSHACPLAKERQGDGIDILVVRELTGGMYFGQPKKTEDIGGGNQRAIDTMVYTTPEIERIAHVAFKAAQLRRKKLTSIDKANVLENGILWREVVTRIGKQLSRRHAGTHVRGQWRDATHAQADAVRRDVLRKYVRRHLERRSGGAGRFAGNVAEREPGRDNEGNTFGLYEPAGGTAPDIAGKNLANPIAQILSARLCCGTVLV